MPMMFFIPSPSLCPVCGEKIDLDTCAYVGPKGSDCEGKPVHGVCHLKVLMQVRNKELDEEKVQRVFDNWADRRARYHYRYG